MIRLTFVFEASCWPMLRQAKDPDSVAALERLALSGQKVQAVGGAEAPGMVWDRAAGAWREMKTAASAACGSEHVRIAASGATGNWRVVSDSEDRSFSGSLKELVDDLLCLGAVRVLRAGGLAALPTETVYGLGADAGNRQAVQRLFAVKGRPADHPLIVHLADASAMPKWAAEVPDLAWKLAEVCWPGPLTIILNRANHVGDWVTGGQATVGLRVPDHALTLRVLEELNGGVAAPSANRFGRVSPTRAGHVLQDLGDEVDFILDGGACRVGVESTIVDLSGGKPVLLRPGGWPLELLEEAAGRSIATGGSATRAPGSHASHYAPRAQVRLVKPLDLAAEIQTLQSAGRRVKAVPAEACSLYADFRQADEEGVEVILVVRPEPRGLGAAVIDRVSRAAQRD